MRRRVRKIDGKESKREMCNAKDRVPLEGSLREGEGDQQW